jgi:hypothetical protein
MSNSIWTGAFWKATAERAVATAAQSALLAIGADQINALTLDWPTLGGFAAGGAVLSLLKSLGVNALTGTGPSVGAEVPVPTARHVANG